MNKVSKLIVVVAVFYMTGCAVNSGVRMHPQLQQELVSVNTVVIAPPEVSIIEQDLEGENLNLVELENSVLAELIQIAKESLTEKGFKLVDFDFSGEISSNEDFAYNLNLVKEGYSEASKILYVDDDKSESDNNKPYTANVGSVINIVSQKTGADTLLLINYSGVKKSGGSVAKDIVVGTLFALLTGYVPVAATEASYVEVALIDGATGDVLWANYGRGQSISSVIMSNVIQPLPDKKSKQVAITK